MRRPARNQNWHAGGQIRFNCIWTLSHIENGQLNRGMYACSE
jgi:hypothetical protein